MPKIVVLNLAEGSTVVFDQPGPTLLQHLQKAGLDWMHACGGKGRCTTCRVKIVSGADQFQPVTTAELRMLENGRLLPDERLSCQAVPIADCQVMVPKSCQLPHIQYTS